MLSWYTLRWIVGVASFNLKLSGLQRQYCILAMDGLLWNWKGRSPSIVASIDTIVRNWAIGVRVLGLGRRQFDTSDVDLFNHVPQWNSTQRFLAQPHTLVIDTRNHAKIFEHVPLGSKRNLLMRSLKRSQKEQHQFQTSASFWWDLHLTRFGFCAHATEASGRHLALSNPTVWSDQNPRLRDWVCERKTLVILVAKPRP